MKILPLISLVFLFLFGTTNFILSQTTPKKNIAVLDLNARGGLTKQEAGTLTDRLRSLLVKTNAFNVIERGKMEMILKEMGFQQSGCTTRECAVQAGRMLNVEEMVTGSIGKIGKLYTIDIVLIDVETAQIIKSITSDYEGEIEGLVSFMQPIAVQLSRLIRPEIKKDEEKGSIEINTDPAKAEVYLNSKKVGNSPLKLTDIPAGEYTIKLIANGYATVEDIVLIEKDKVTEFEKKMRAIGGLNILTEPTDAQIYINDKLIGNSPIKLDNVSPGEYIVKVLAPGYAPDVKKVLVNKGKVQEYKAKLKKLFTINIISKPAGAEVIINDKSVGKTPLKQTEIDGTRLFIKVQKENYQVWQKEILVKKDEQLNAELKLSEDYKKSMAAKAKETEEPEMKPDKPGKSKNWLWISGTAVIVGGSITYLLLSKKDDEGVPTPTPSGFPSPPGRP